MDVTDLARAQKLQCRPAELGEQENLLSTY
jgi:hypothetical protein